MNLTKPAVQAGSIRFTYDTEPVLDDVSLNIEEGDFMGLVGPNGGGKTTLLKVILGLLKPQSGYVHIFGKEPQQACSLIGYVPQYINLDKDFPINILNVVLMGLLSNIPMFGRYKKEHKERALESLRQVNMLDYANRSFGDLSGGQRQRVLIARGLVGDPKLLIMDEPTAHVDSYTQGQLFELLHDLNETCTIMIVSHDIGFVSAHINKVACLNRRLVLHPTKDFEPDMLEHLYHAPMKMVDHSARL
jgi:zinc transport system ATP-binding protein